MLKNFFILCSGSDTDILEQCSIGEQNKYADIGATVFFIFLLFSAIETSPIFAKLVSPKGSYDFKLEDAETAVKTWVEQKVHERHILLKTDIAIKNKVYNDIADEDELYQYKRKSARELMQLQADAFYKQQKKHTLRRSG